MSKEELFGDMKFGGSLGYSGHEIVELKTLRVVQKSRTTVLGFRRAKCILFRDLLRSIQWNMVPERRGVQER